MQKRLIEDLTDYEKALLFDAMTSTQEISQNTVDHYLTLIEIEKTNLASRLNRLTGPSSVGSVAQPITSTLMSIQPVLSEELQKRRGRGRPKGSGKKSGAAAAPVKPQPSSAIAESRKVQGRYLSLVRRFPERQRARFRKIAKAQGRDAAIGAMTSALDPK